MRWLGQRQKVMVSHGKAWKVYLLFNCVCVPGRIWLWQNVVNNGPSIEATRQAIQRDLGTWTARYVHLLLQGGAPYSYGP